jgi:recombination protein RecT
MTNQVTIIDQVRGNLTRMEPEFARALPKHITPERFTRVAITAVQNVPDLLTCDRTTLYSACMRAAQDGLLPDGREGAIIARAGQAVWMPMVAGITKKVRNSGDISTWSVHEVKENDQFDYELGDAERIYHKPALKNRGATIGVYSIVLMKDGERSREFMSIEEVNAIRDRSDGYKYAVEKKKKNPWITDPDEMAKKTVIRRHAKRLPMSTDLDDFLRQDDLDDPALVQRVPEPTVQPYVEPVDLAPKGRRPKALEKAAAAAHSDEGPPLYQDDFSEASQEPHGDPLGD